MILSVSPFSARSVESTRNRMISPKILFIVLLVQLYSSVLSKRENSEKREQRFRIVSGRQADVSEFPYQASIEYHYNQWCGGSIIAPRAILTAAHCVASLKSSRDVSADLMVVRVGNSVSSSGGSLYTIKRFIVHKRYGENPNVDENDIAIVVLDKRLKFSPSVRTIELVTSEPTAGEMAWVTGFGRQDPMRRSGNNRHLMAVEIPIMDKEKCKDIHKPFGNTVTNKMICAGFESGSKDSCKGDSGGPLAVDEKLAGIVAWGMGCGRDGMPGVYTSVARYYSWIMNNLKAIEIEEDSMRSPMDDDYDKYM